MANDLTDKELERLRGRDWPAVRECLLEVMPNIDSLGELPSVSSDQILILQNFKIPEQPQKSSADSGIRQTTLWEAISLYQKSSYARHAAAKLAAEGFHTWSLFNDYHAAYFSAKGVSYLLGVTFPIVNDKQCLLDVYAEPENRKSGKAIKAASLTEFNCIPLKGLIDQHQLWAWFQRTIASTRQAPWEPEAMRSISLLKPSRSLPRQRNYMLYRTTFWIATDIVRPVSSEWLNAPASKLDTESPDFLNHLSTKAMSVFDALMDDLAKYSRPVRRQIEAARSREPLSFKRT